MADPNDPEVRAFLAGGSRAGDDWFQRSDAELVRVIEDLIWLLINKGVLQIHDLPEAARRKVQERMARRTAGDGDGYGAVPDNGVL